MSRLFIAILLFTTLSFMVTPCQTVARNSTPYQDFDRDDCYDNCPCNLTGFEQACGECVQKCDREFWRIFDEKLKKLEKKD